MKSKKLLISLLSVAIVIVLIVVLAAILTVKKVIPIYHGFDGQQIALTDGGVPSDEIESTYRGKSIVFLSKNNMMSELNEKYHEWHAFAVVKHFPNVVEVHFVGSVAIAKFNGSNGTVYIDCFGCVTETPEKDGVIDITSAFDVRDLSQSSVGDPLKFESEESNRRLGYVLDAILATWQCWVDIPDMSQTLGEKDVFTFDGDGNMVIRPKLHGKIVIQAPDTNLAERVIKALGVYYNDKIDLHDDAYTITVFKNGRITTPSK